MRVVDFTWAIAGSFATRLLADLGADVIKLESEHRLDPIRHIGPQPTAVVSLDTNGVFQDCGAGKRAVTLNVDTPEGQELARQLIATADVVTANYTPDRLDRWGFDRATLAELRPGLIVANLAVMGLSGPDSGWRSYGNGLVAMSGVAAHTGFDGRMPQCLGTMHTDFTVPYFGAMQILAALHHRDRTGEGCYLEMSQYESSVRLMDVELAVVLNGGDDPGRNANRSAWSSPHGVFPAREDDRWVAIACRDDGERAALAAVIGIDPWALSDDAVATWTRTLDRADHRRRAAGCGCPGQWRGGPRRPPPRPDDPRLLAGARPPVGHHRRGPAGTGGVGWPAPAAAAGPAVDGAHVRRPRRRARARSLPVQRPDRHPGPVVMQAPVRPRPLERPS